MLKRFEAEKTRLAFRLDPSFPRLSDKQKQAADDYWQHAKQSNPKLFDAPILCCNGAKFSWGRVDFSLNSSNYSVYKWARDHGYTIPGTYSMGDCVVPYDFDGDSYVFAQRNKGVSWDEAKLSGFGGVLEPPDGQVGQEIDNFVAYLMFHIGRELSEETTSSSLSAIRFLGGYYDEETRKVEFFHSVMGRGIALNGQENKRIIETPRSDLRGFVSANSHRIEASTLNHLNHWAKKMEQRPLVS